jgi:hypothetical protein
MNWCILADELSLANAVAPAPKSSKAADKPLAALPQTWWERLPLLVLSEAQSLVRVSRVESPEAALLSPEQSFFVRENLKLKLLNARLGLLSRQIDSASADLRVAEAALKKYFDQRGAQNQGRQCPVAAGAATNALSADSPDRRNTRCAGHCSGRTLTMRAAVWLLGLFGVAVALALFASGNGATITVYWPPHRVDLSLNFVLLLLLLLFLLLHLALRALAALLAMPQQAQSWRLRHQERGIHSALLDALSHLIAGRFIRARKAAELVLARDSAMTRQGDSSTDAARLRVLAHLLASRERAGVTRQRRPGKAFSGGIGTGVIARCQRHPGRRACCARCAGRWRTVTASAALDWLDQLPSGVARRTVALRMRSEGGAFGRSHRDRTWKRRDC